MLSKKDCLTFSAIGDLSFGDSPKMLGLGVRAKTDMLGCDYLFKGGEYFFSSDIVFANLEGVLSNYDYDPTDFNRAQLRGNPNVVKCLRKVGVTVLSVANNHMMQYGPRPFEETCHILRENNIKVVGLSGDNIWHCLPVIIKRRNLKVGFLGYAVKDGYPYEALYATYDLNRICGDIYRLQKEVDHVVVSLHWGDEFIRTPSLKQRMDAFSMYKAGASLILGHHPHVVQDVEVFGGCCSVYYSLGNYISDMVWNPRTREGLAVKLSIFKNRIKEFEKFYVNILNDYSVELIKISNADIDSLTSPDRECASSEFEYMKKVREYMKDNRNLSHLYLFKNIYRYKFLMFTKIVSNSIKSFASNYL